MGLTNELNQNEKLVVLNWIVFFFGESPITIVNFNGCNRTPSKLLSSFAAMALTYYVVSAYKSLGNVEHKHTCGNQVRQFESAIALSI